MVSRSKEEDDNYIFFPNLTKVKSLNWESLFETVAAEVQEEQHSQGTVPVVNTNDVDAANILSSSSDEFEDASNYDEQPVAFIRTSSRINKGVPPKRYEDEVNIAINKPDPQSFEEALSIEEEKLEWQKSMKDEISSLLKNNTWELSDLPVDRKAIGSKWLFKRKLDAKGNIVRFKARVVAQGFSQKYGQDYDLVFAPVVRQTTFRICLSIAGKEKMLVKHFDAKTAFLNGPLNEVLYMKPPKGFETNGKVCLLKKRIYGLKQSARNWNTFVHDIMMKNGFKQNSADKCLYLKKSTTGEICFVLIYVDDILVSSKSQPCIDKVFKLFGKHFEIKDLGLIKSYLGIDVTQDKEGNYQISQSGYIHKLAEEMGLSKSKPSSIPMSPSYFKDDNNQELLPNNKDYQKYIGSLLYISVNSRPDIAVSVAILARKTSNPNRNDWNELKRIVKYLFSTSNFKLVLSRFEESLTGYADSSWAENLDRKSTSGYVFLFNGGVISWCSRKQSCVALSSTESEFIALCEAVQEAIWLKSLLTDMDYTINKINIKEDNQSCLKIIQNDKFSNRSKHIDTKYNFIKDFVKNGTITCQYCSTEEMLADILTKPLGQHKFEYLRSMMLNVDNK